MARRGAGTQHRLPPDLCWPGEVRAVLVVHGIWRDASGVATPLALWAEDSHAPIGAARERRGAPAAHPFAAPVDALANLLGDLATKAVHGVATIGLPTRAGRPADSAELLRDDLAAATRSPATIADWRVPVLEYGVDD